MATSRKIVYPCLVTKFQGIRVFTFPMKIKDAIFIGYVAARGVHDEEAAVQRILVTRRIASIREFVLKGNSFFNTFILNWTADTNKPKYAADGRTLTVPLLAGSAQILDGQHRLAGLDRAMSERPAIGNQEILVSLAVGLATSEAASIFLNINTEQRPVPKSLIYDLFGEVENDPDHVINRATDIARELNDADSSPYRNFIKFPGSAFGIGALDSSTVVASLRPHLDNGGAFNKVKLRSLKYQKSAVLNYFSSIKSFYDEKGIWENKGKNPFLRAAGFSGAIDFLTDSLLPRCAQQKDFSIEAMRNFISLDRTGLLLMDDIKQLDGKSARRSIRDHLETHIKNETPDQNEYSF